MIKVLLLSFFLILTLSARQNPFFPSKGEVDIPNTSNADSSLKPLKRATIKLPSYARVIQKVTIEYKNLDGSIETKSIELNNAVDWHLPIFISQSMGSIENSKPRKSFKKQKFTQFFRMKYIRFYKANKQLKLVTKDKMLRSFLLTNPHRIVMDFKRDTNLKSIRKTFTKNIFKEIRVGNHDKYYRVVVGLDGPYIYTKQKTSTGYLYILK